VQEEYRNQAKGETAEEEAVGIGHGENPEYVLSGAGRSLGSENLFNASILDLKTGIQVRGSSVNYRSLDDGIGAMGELVEKLTRAPEPAAPEPAAPKPAAPEPATQEPATQEPATPKPAGESGGGSAIGRNLGVGVLNLFLGLGSFSQKDWGGGAAILVGYALAGGLLTWELLMDYYDPLAGIPGPIAIGVAGVTAVFGFVRPFIFNRNRKVAEALDGLHITVVPEAGGVKALSLTYGVRF
jgi:hypothetical protein